VSRVARNRAIALVVLFGIASLAACSSAPSPRPSSSALGDDAITVASFNFPESELLADVYATALRKGGYDVRTARALGPRELVDPALARGLVELVPEYSGTALQFLSLGRAKSTPDVAASHARLEQTLRGSTMTALAPSPAQDANAVVVTPATAEKYRLRTVSDLERVAGRLTFGGPPECPSRPLCLQGLRAKYGLHFRSFLTLDAGGPLTRQALEQGQIDVGLMFTTEPLLVNGGLIELRDDRALQPAENVTPLMHRQTVRRFGPELVRLVNRVSSRLTTSELRTLNALVAMGERPSVIASRWVEQEDLR
jgi:osmoprotectant transport system substrate-binding protein